MTSNSTAAELIARSNRLGADPKNTNYAGGNTSAKGTETDPVTGEPVELLWVKGSGGDLGTLTETGLAVLRLDRMRALVDVYPGLDREDEMVAAFDYCLHGKGGAAPSIDTAMHGLVDAAHVDHLHPDSGIAIATAADGEQLTKEIFGDKVVWVPWRRPGFQLGLDIAAIKAQQPAGRSAASSAATASPHGARPATGVEKNSLWIIRTAERYIARALARRTRSGPAVEVGAAQPAPSAGRAPPSSRRPARRRRRRTGRWSATSPTTRWCSTSWPAAEPPAAGRARHVVPRPLPAHQGQADGARPAGRRSDREGQGPGRRAARGLPRPTTPGYYERQRDHGQPRDAWRGPAGRPGPGRRDVQLRQGQADRARGR